MTSTFMLKLVLTPALIVVVSLASRRWGSLVGGLLTGLPLTSGPVAFFLAVDEGPAFAARAAVGTLAGIMSVAAFAVAYSRSAQRLSWPGATLLGWSAYFAATVVLHFVELRLVPVFLAVAATLCIALALLPDQSPAQPVRTAPWWDVPCRALAATLFVLLLTSIARRLGPQLSGLLAPFPIYGTVLAVAAHHFKGPAEAAAMLRGLTAGSFSFATFFLVLGLMLERQGLGTSFGGAVVSALAVQGYVFWRVRRSDLPTEQ